MKPEQITAWALDEASAEERLQFEAELRENPTAQKGAEETKAFCDFLLAELRDESLALTDEQRERLKETAAVPGPVSAAEERADMPVSWSVLRKEQGRQKPARWTSGPALRLAAAACLTLGCVWVWQERGTRAANGRSPASLADGAADEPKFKISAGYSGSGSLATPASIPGTEVPGMPVQLWAGTPVLPGLPPLAVFPPGAPPSVLTGNTTMTVADVEKLKRMDDHAAYGLRFDNMDAMAMTSLSSSGHVARLDSGAGQSGVIGATNFEIAREADVGLKLAGSSAALGNYDISIAQYQDVLRVDPYNSAARRGMENAEQKRQEDFKSASEHQRAKMLSQVDENWEDKVPVPTLAGNVMAGTGGLAATMPVNNPAPDARYFNLNDDDISAPGPKGVTAFGDMDSRVENESYQRIIENELKDVAREPLSTFSIDVDTAAYANVRRFLNQGMAPPPDAVRIEELVNYFPAAEEGPPPGAKEPFAVRVEMAPCPWQPEHRLARIAIKGRELGSERKASNLVFLVDVSGSMGEPSKLPLVQQSLRMLTEQLGEEDRVTMVVYAGSSGLVLPPTSGDRKTEILAAIDHLQAGGSTHGSAGIQLAYEQAVAGFIKGGVNRVILCTDGDFNVGVSSPEELEKLITKKAKSGVFLSVLGFGTGNLKDRTMETLADKGNGNYAYIDSLGEARKVLVEQMSGTLVTIAKDVKIQVEFNPAMVRSYRLVGYENRLLKKEDFNDDTKDAGEIGAGHSVVALYEVVPANLPPGAEPRPTVDGLRYQQAPATPAPTRLAEAAKSGEVMTVKLRYKEPDSSLSKLIEVPAKDEGKTLTASSTEFKFSAAVAGFGLLLRDSAYQGTLGWETVRKLALDGKGDDKLGYRGEFLQLIDKARGLKETRP